LASCGTLIFLYATASRLLGPRAALYAVGQFALVAPFVYYAKMANLDVPYLFYFAVALWAYTRIMDDLGARNFIVFGLAAVAAVCTKDQAYGLFVLPSLLIFYRLRQSHAVGRVRFPTWRTATDTRLLVAVGLALLFFAVVHNLVFNWEGFRSHVNISAGGVGRGEYRVFAATWSGHAALLALTVDIARVACGWPLFLTAVVGFVALCGSSTRRRVAWLMAAPMVSYYLTVLAVIGFNYDRFLLPLLLIASIFGGFALARITGGAWRPVGVGLAAIVFAYSVIYAVSVDVAMLRDSRYTVEQYLATQPGGGAPAAFVFPDTYYPRLRLPQAYEVHSVEEIEAWRPAYFVLNDEYADFEPSNYTRGQLIAGIRSGDLGYRPIHVVRGGFWFPFMPWPHRELAWPRPGPSEPVTSSLRHISPTYVVYRRDP
jgi:Dolichyl-phosphate-mannose-protein mannosyltransferase